MEDGFKKCKLAAFLTYFTKFNEINERHLFSIGFFWIAGDRGFSTFGSFVFASRCLFVSIGQDGVCRICSLMEEKCPSCSL